MALDQINNGDSGADARAKINAAIAAVELVRGSGVLQGYTDPGSEAQPPPEAILTFSGLTKEFVIVVDVPTGSYVFTASASDPGNGSVWVGSSLWSTLYDAAYYTKEAMVAVGITDLTIYNGVSETINFLPSFTTGSLTVTDPNGNAAITIDGGGSSTPAVPPSGEVDEVVLIAQDGTKTVKPVLLGYYIEPGFALDATVQFALKVGETYYPLGDDVPNNELQGNVPANSFFAEWVSGRASASLVARMTSAVPTEGMLNCWAIVERV